jgi:hypothetical protein
MCAYAKGWGVIVTDGVRLKADKCQSEVGTLFL